MAFMQSHWHLRIGICAMIFVPELEFPLLCAWAVFLMNFVFSLLKAWAGNMSGLPINSLCVFPGEADIRNHFRHIWIRQCQSWWGCPIPGKDFQGHRNDQGQTLVLNFKNIIQFEIHPKSWSRVFERELCYPS